MSFLFSPPSHMTGKSIFSPANKNVPVNATPSINTEW